MLVLVKRNKRMYIMDGERVVYTPPDFLRHRCNRDMLRVLARSMQNGQPEIEAISRFETMRRP